MEKLRIKSLSSQAKVLGTVISIAGALVVVLYEGPAVIRTLRGSLLGYQPLISSPHSNWVLGGLLLIGDFLLFAFWYIVQTQIVTIYPAELLVVSIYNLCTAIITAPVAFFLEQENMSAWKISSHMMLYAILYAGLLGTSFATVILTWGLHLKGPVYVALFTPLQIVIAAVTSVIFLGDSLYLGSVIGAIIISVGFYICMWGKAREERVHQGLINGSLESGSATHAPLLQ